jgi:hypothetical protein
MPRFPPRRRRRMYELILIEIIAVPAERSRGRHNPRVVKRKMSSFPTKARAAPPPGQVFHYEEHIRIVTPPTRQRIRVHRRSRHPRMDQRGTSRERPQRRPASARSGWSTSAPGVPAACRAPLIASATA